MDSKSYIINKNTIENLSDFHSMIIGDSYLIQNTSQRQVMLSVKNAIPDSVEDVVLTVSSFYKYTHKDGISLYAYGGDRDQTVGISDFFLASGGGEGPAILLENGTSSKISELSEKNNLENTDYLVLANAGNDKISGSNLISKTFRHVNLFVNPEESLNQLDNAKVGDVYAIEGDGIFGEIEMKQGDTLTCILDVAGTPQTLNNFIHNRDNGLLAQSLFNRNLNPDNGGPSNQLQYNNSGDRWICSQDGTYLGKELKQGDCVECIQYTGENPVVGDFVFWYGENHINDDISLTSKHFSNKNLFPNLAAINLANAKSGDRWVCAIDGDYLGTALGSGDVIECKVDVSGQPSNLDNFETYPHTDNVVYKSGLIDTLDSTSITEAPTANAVKQLEDKKANKSDLKILKGLPGLPVEEGLTMAFFADTSTCTIDDNTDKCSLFTDPLTERSFSQNNEAAKPKLKIDVTNNQFYLEFSDTQTMTLSDFASSEFGGETGKTTTVILVSKFVTDSKQNFMWIKKNPDDTYDNNVRFNASFLRNDGNSNINFGTLSGSQLSVPNPSGVSGNLSKFICIRDDNVGTMYVNGSQIGQTTSLTDGFNSSDNGDMSINGRPDNTTQYRNLHLYLLLIYNRAFSLSEKASFDLFLQRRYG